jgi:hypothetical protein
VTLLCLVSVSVAVCLLLWEARQTVIDADSLVLQEKLELHYTSQNVNAALLQIGLTTDEARRAAMEQRLYWNQLGKLSVDFLSRTDRNINDQLLPAAALLLTTTADSEQQLTASADITLGNLGHSADVFTMRLNDSRLDEMVTNWNETSLHVVGMTANAELVTDDAEHEVHKLVYPPPRKWWQKWITDPVKTAAHLITIPITSF